MTSYLVLEQRCDHEALGPHVYTIDFPSAARRCPGGVVSRFAAEQVIELPILDGINVSVESVIDALRDVEPAWTATYDSENPAVIVVEAGTER